MRWIQLSLAAALLFGGCGGSSETEDTDETEDTSGDEVSDAPVPPMQTVEPPAGGEPSVNASTGGCRSSSECAQGEICVGEAGCDQVWTCQPARPCTRDLVIYCSCGGETVEGSGSCPPEPYAHRGACE